MLLIWIDCIMNGFCWKNTNCIIYLFYISYRSLNVNFQVNHVLLLHSFFPISQKLHLCAVHTAYKFDWCKKFVALLSKSLLKLENWSSLKSKLKISLDEIKSEIRVILGLFFLTFKLLIQVSVKRKNELCKKFS